MSLIDYLGPHEALVIGICIGWAMSTLTYIIIEVLRKEPK